MAGNPATVGCRASNSDFADIDGVDAFATFLGFKFDPVILLHCGTIEAGYVYEKVFFRFVVGHEAIALGFVEEFDDAGLHAKNKCGKVRIGPGKGCRNA